YIDVEHHKITTSPTTRLHTLQQSKKQTQPLVGSQAQHIECLLLNRLSAFSLFQALLKKWLYQPNHVQDDDLKQAPGKQEFLFYLLRTRLLILIFHKVNLLIPRQ